MPLSDLELKKFIIQKGINDRKLAIQNLIDIYKDDWETIIREEINRQFTTKSQAKLRFLITREMNVVKRVTNETALVYKNNAVRKALIEDGKDEAGEDKFKEDDNYESIMSNTSINSQMKQVNRFTKLTNQTMLRVVWRNKKMDYDLLTFDNVEIFTDPEDWTKIIAVKYFIDLDLQSNRADFTDDEIGTTDTFLTGRSDTSFGVPITDLEGPTFSTMFLWTLEDKDKTSKEYTKSFVRTFRKVKDDMQEVEKDDNPYFDEDGFPVLPFVFFPNRLPHDSLTDFTTGNDIFDGNMNVALNYIHLNELIKYQSYKQIWVKASDTTSFPKTWDLDPQSVLTLTDEGNNTEVGTLDLQSDITKIFDVIVKRIIMILGSRGIPPSAVRVDAGSGPESGIKIRLDKQTLFEIREDDIEIYREKEKALFKITRIVNNVHNTEKISDKAVLNIDFAEINFPTTRQEEAAADTLEINNNTLTGWQVLQRKNPDLTDDQAKEKFQLNKDFNSNSLGGLTDINQPNNTQENENA